MITSANEGEGKSTVAANLARVLARRARTTVLIDADLRRPVVAGIYGVDTQIGLAQVLVGDITAEEALQESGIENLKVMSAGRVPHNPSELLGSHRMQHLLQELSRDHLVVLDAPPLLPVTDAALLAAIADGAMVVFAIGQTYKEQARLAKRRLGQTGGRMLGVVLNRAPLRGLGAVVYGYGYGSYTTELRVDEADSTPSRAIARSRPEEAGGPGEVRAAGRSDAALGRRSRSWFWPCSTSWCSRWATARAVGCCHAFSAPEARLSASSRRHPRRPRASRPRTGVVVRC